MCLTTCYLSHNLVLQAYQLLRLLDGVILVAAELLDDTSWQAELTTFCTSPAIDLAFFRQSYGMQATTGHLLNFVVLEIFYL